MRNAVLFLKIRQFRVPALNFDANGYMDLVSWQDIDRHDPPILSNYSEKQIRAFINKADTNVIQLPHFPCHTESFQIAERCIKLVTEASAAVFGQEQRDGFFRARLESRTFNSKAEYRLS